MAQTVKRLCAMWETGFDPWVGKIPWRRKWQPTPVLLPGKSHGQRSLGLQRVRHNLATSLSFPRVRSPGYLAEKMCTGLEKKKKTWEFLISFFLIVAGFCDLCVCCLLLICSVAY